MNDMGKSSRGDGRRDATPNHLSHHSYSRGDKMGMARDDAAANVRGKGKKLPEGQHVHRIPEGEITQIPHNPPTKEELEAFIVAHVEYMTTLIQKWLKDASVLLGDCDKQTATETMHTITERLAASLRHHDLCFLYNNVERPLSPFNPALRTQTSYG